MDWGRADRGEASASGGIGATLARLEGDCGILLVLLLSLAIALALGMAAPVRAWAADDDDDWTPPPMLEAEEIGPDVTEVEVPDSGRRSNGNVVSGDVDMPDAATLILNGILNKRKEINISGYGLTKAQAYDLYMDVWYEHPEIFYVYSTEIVTNKDTGIAQTIKPTYMYRQDLIEGMRTEYNTAIGKALTWVKADMNKLDKIKAVYDYICQLNTYDHLSVTLGKDNYPDYPNAHNAYGALVKGLCVCEGYAVGYKAIMNAINLGDDCQVVLGWGTNGASKGGHAWDAVKVDGAWYQLDATWDDRDRTVPATSYFMKKSLDRHINGSINWVPAGTGAVGLHKGDVAYESTLYDEKADWPAYVGADGFSYAQLEKDLTKAELVVDGSAAKLVVAGAGTTVTNIRISMMADGKLVPLGTDARMVYCSGYTMTGTNTAQANFLISGIGNFTGHVRKTADITLQRELAVNFQVDGTTRSSQNRASSGTFDIVVKQGANTIIQRTGVTAFTATVPVGATWEISNVQPPTGFEFCGVKSAGGISSSESAGVVSSGAGNYNVTLGFDTANGTTITLVPGNGIKEYWEATDTYIRKNVESIVIGEGGVSGKIYCISDDGKLCDATWTIGGDSSALSYYGISSSVIVDGSYCNVARPTVRVKVDAGGASATLSAKPARNVFFEATLDGGVVPKGEELRNGTYDIVIRDASGAEAQHVTASLAKVDYLNRCRYGLKGVPAGSTWEVSNVQVGNGYVLDGLSCSTMKDGRETPDNDFDPSARSGAIPMACNTQLVIRLNFKKVTGLSLTIDPNGGTMTASNNENLAWKGTSTTAQTVISSVGKRNLVKNGNNFNNISAIGFTHARGYVFDGLWDAKDSGGEQVYDASLKCVDGSYWKKGRFVWTGNGDLKLYAHWKQPHTLTLSKGAGVACYKVGGKQVSSLKLFEGATAKVQVVMQAGAGYVATSRAWSVTKGANRGSKVAGSGATVTITMGSSDAAVRASFTKPVALAVDPNGGTMTATDPRFAWNGRERTAKTTVVPTTGTTKLVRNGTGFNSLAKLSLTRAGGYAFDGLWTTRVGGTQVYDASLRCVNGGSYWKDGRFSWSGKGTITLYAHWKSA